jgi:hypothetical protein
VYDRKQSTPLGSFCFLSLGEFDYGAYCFIGRSYNACRRAVDLANEVFCRCVTTIRVSVGICHLWIGKNISAGIPMSWKKFRFIDSNMRFLETFLFLSVKWT